MTIDIASLVATIDAGIAEHESALAQLRAARAALSGMSTTPVEAPSPAPLPAPTESRRDAIKKAAERRARPTDDGVPTRPAKTAAPPVEDSGPVVGGSKRDVLDRIMSDGNEHTVQDLVVRARDLGTGNVTRGDVDQYFSARLKAGTFEKVAPGRYRMAS